MAEEESGEESASTVLRMGETASARLPSATMVVSRALQERYREMHGIETFYVPNGGVLREALQPAKILEWGLEPGKYVLFLGRFSPEKGCHLLVEAFEQIRDRCETSDGRCVQLLRRLQP